MEIDGGAWGSALRVSDFAAIRSVGFEPVGQVFGAAGYYLSTVLGAGCPGTSADSLLRDGPTEGPAAKVARGLYEGRQTAIDRMTGQCADLGGHGIVGAALRIKETPPEGLTAGAIAFTVMGTAVRAAGCPPLGRPDFAKLIMAGWVPVGIALGISVAGLHDELVTANSGPWGSGNAEVPGYTALVAQARQDARRQLEQTVRSAGADGVVMSAMTLRISGDACRAHPGGSDYFAEAVATGTSVARFAGSRTGATPGLAVIHVGTARPRRTS